MISAELMYEKVMHRMDMTKETKEEELQEIIRTVLEDESKKEFIPLSEKIRLSRELFNAFRRLDILQDLIEDDSITEIMVNGTENIFYEKEGKLYRTNRHFFSESRLCDVIQQIVGEANRYVNETSPIVDWRQYPSMTDALQWAGWIWRGTAVWDKTNSRPQKGRFRQQTEFIIWGSNGPMPISRPVSCLPGVFRYGNPQNRVHVTEKPLQLMKDVVQICEPGGRILDPFAGAGTTILAAAQQGYQAVGIEVTDAYFQLGTERVREALKEEVDVQ